MAAFASTVGVPLSQVRFTFDGETIDPHQTLQSLNIEDGDILDAHAISSTRGGAEMPTKSKVSRFNC